MSFMTGMQRHPSTSSQEIEVKQPHWIKCMGLGSSPMRPLISQFTSNEKCTKSWKHEILGVGLWLYSGHFQNHKQFEPLDWIKICLICLQLQSAQIVI